MLHIATLICNHENEFRQFFGLELRRFFSSATGFDIIRFDAELSPPDNQSLAEFIEQRHGARAVELVRILIKAT